MEGVFYEIDGRDGRKSGERRREKSGGEREISRKEIGSLKDGKATGMDEVPSEV